VNRELRTAFAFVVVSCVAVPCLAASRSVKPVEIKADHILVLKSERTLILMHDGKPLKTYKVALGGEPVGPKTRRGDHKTPEGTYTIDRRNIHSQYHRALHVSYPSVADAANARKLHASPGGDIMIHGLPNGMGWVGSAHRARDWTDGCIAVTDEEIDEIWKLVPDGTPVEIKP
jgi:murein L,D-transpeptidase YafK